MDNKPEHIILIPDSGPLLELLRSNSLDQLFVPFASLAVPDAVLHELLRSAKDEGHAIAVWVKVNNIPIFDTRTFAHGQCKELKESNLPQGAVVDLCLQEIMNEINLSAGKTTGVFLLEEHKCIGKQTFFSGGNCKKVTLKAFRKFLAGMTVPEPQAAHDAPSKVEPEAVVSLKEKRSSKTKKLAKPVPLEETAHQTDDTTQKATQDSTLDVHNGPNKVAPESPSLGGGFLTAMEAANPKLIEKRLRELAGQTTSVSRKTIEAFKARAISKSPADLKPVPDSQAVEQFRKSLM